jgi:hypothetical protein
LERLVVWQGCAVPPLQTDEGYGGIGAATTKTGANRNILDEMDPEICANASQALETSDGLDSQIRFVGGASGGREIKVIGGFNMDFVTPVDGLHYGTHLVISIITTSAYPQIQINLRERSQLHKYG